MYEIIILLMLILTPRNISLLPFTIELHKFLKY